MYLIDAYRLISRRVVLPDGMYGTVKAAHKQLGGDYRFLVDKDAGGTELVDGDKLVRLPEFPDGVSPYVTGEGLRD